jgi:hypothetical protein
MKLGEAVAVVVGVLSSVVALARSDGVGRMEEVADAAGSGVVAGEDLNQVLRGQATTPEVLVRRRVDARILGVVLDVEDAVVIEVVAGGEAWRGELRVARRQLLPVTGARAVGDLGRRQLGPIEGNLVAQLPHVPVVPHDPAVKHRDVDVRPACAHIPGFFQARPYDPAQFLAGLQARSLINFAALMPVVAVEANRVVVRHRVAVDLVGA